MNSYTFRMNQQLYFVYMLRAGSAAEPYVGIARNLSVRMYEHLCDWESLVYFEAIGGPEAALAREFELRALRPDEKQELIDQKNSKWRDISNLCY